MRVEFSLALISVCVRFVYQVNITRTGCGSNKLCLSAPDSCDPTGTGPCLFGSAAAVLPVLPNGTTLSFQLQGESAGYVALGLSLSPSEVTNAKLRPSEMNCVSFVLMGPSFFFSAPPSSPDSQQDVKPPVKYDHVAFIDLTQYLFDKDPSSQTDGRCKERYVSLLIWGDRRLHFLSAVNRDVCDIIFVTRVLSGCYYD